MPCKGLFNSSPANPNQESALVWFTAPANFAAILLTAGAVFLAMVAQVIWTNSG